jgi:hypothetical protein
MICINERITGLIQASIILSIAGQCGFAGPMRQMFPTASKMRGIDFYTLVFLAIA